MSDDKGVGRSHPRSKPWSGRRSCPWSWRRASGWGAAALGVAVMGATLALHAPSASAQEGDRLTVAAAGPEAARAAADELLAHLAPRFRFRARVALETVAPEDADVVLSPEAGEGPVVFEGPGGLWRARIADPAEDALARRFLDWLTSPAGARAIAGHLPERGEGFRAAGRAPVAAPEPVIVEDATVKLGEKLAFQHCARCHVIDARNRLGGMGATPSFGALRTFRDWRARFDAFWTLKPHGSFTQVKGVTPPFDPRFPPALAPIEMTVEEAEALTVFAASIPPKDLGKPIQIE